jgi:hypothetical protein
MSSSKTSIRNKRKATPQPLPNRRRLKRLISEEDKDKDKKDDDKEKKSGKRMNVKQLGVPVRTPKRKVMPRPPAKRHCTLWKEGTKPKASASRKRSAKASSAKASAAKASAAKASASKK